MGKERPGRTPWLLRSTEMRDYFRSLISAELLTDGASRGFILSLPLLADAADSLSSRFSLVAPVFVPGYIRSLENAIPCHAVLVRRDAESRNLGEAQWPAKGMLARPGGIGTTQLRRPAFQSNRRPSSHLNNPIRHFLKSLVSTPDEC